LAKNFKQVVVIAHNGQSFDHQFILNELLHKSDIEPKLIMRGTKIIQMQIKNIRFLDSMNYLAMPLSQLPKAFDLSTNLKKGYFPHLFNRTENINYVGPIPPMHYYSPDSMIAENRKMFIEWYEQNKNAEFNMKRDLLDYCKNDVLILTEACIKFRKLLLEENNVCPFTEATTIASACNLVFRRNFLKPETIGLIPKKGYRFVDTQSKIALQWLIWEEDQRKITIQHAARQKEAIIKNINVDGFCSERKQIFQFHGCYFHGHPKCFPYKRNESIQGNKFDTLDIRFENTITRTERLKSFGYEVIEMWECDFREQLIEKEDEMSYLINHPLLKTVPLNREMLFMEVELATLLCITKQKKMKK